MMCSVALACSHGYKEIMFRKTGILDSGTSDFRILAARPKGPMIGTP
jgi:hypothetical protein